MDRWKWLRGRLPLTRKDEGLLDVGCGSGGFTIGAAIRGYRSTGISWDERNQRVAEERAIIINAVGTSFDVVEVRQAGECPQYFDKFDVVICFECIEHILDDRKLLVDMGRCLRPGGRLLLTTPYLYCPPIGRQCVGPFSKTEDGSHVRRGYTHEMLVELCNQANLTVESSTYCSGFMSQQVTKLLRRLSSFNPVVAWVLTVPFRLLPPVLDPILSCLTKWPQSSICLEAYKGRFTDQPRPPCAQQQRLV